MVAEGTARDELCMDVDAINATTAYAKLREPVMKFKMMMGRSMAVMKSTAGLLVVIITGAARELAALKTMIKTTALIKCNTPAIAERAVAAMNVLHPSNGGPLGPQHKTKLPEMIPKMLPKMDKASPVNIANTMLMVAKRSTATPR
jgi:hypothetical protein